MRIVAFGDSVTRGYGGGHPWPERLAASLHQACPPAALEVVNAGVDGNTAADGLARLERTGLYGSALAGYNEAIRDLARRRRL